MKFLSDLSKSNKILAAIFALHKEGKERITLEDVAVKLWKLFPTEFCMRGYPQYPNVNITKYITKLFNDSLITGSVSNYKITSKGINFAQNFEGEQNQNEKIIYSNEQPRHIEIEILRILNSKVFKYFSKNHDENFVESDFFEFLGTSSRSLTTKDKKIFQTRYNTMVKEVIPFCEKIMKEDKNAAKIVILWKVLSKKFGEIIKK